MPRNMPQAETKIIEKALKEYREGKGVNWRLVKSEMRTHYKFDKMKRRKNPHAKKLKQRKLRSLAYIQLLKRVRKGETQIREGRVQSWRIFKASLKKVNKKQQRPKKRVRR